MAKKGGTGKTTLTQGLASAARARGLRVWVADFDPQCNLTNLLAGASYKEKLVAAARKEAPRPPALFDVLSEEEPGPADLRLALYPAADSWSGVKLLPATARLDLIEHAPQDQETAQRFSRALSGLTDGQPLNGLEIPELILCDTRPAFNLLTVMAATAANLVLVAVEPERFPLEGLRDAWATLGKLIEAGALPNLDEAAVVMTQVDRREAEHRARCAEIEKRYKSVLWSPEMPDRTVVAQAISAGLPLHDYPDPRAAEPIKVLDAWLDKIMTRGAAA